MPVGAQLPRRRLTDDARVHDEGWGPAARHLRLVAAAGAVAPPLASVALLGAGWLSPGYDPARRTISRLAEPGAPYALEVRVILAALALALLGTAWVLDRRHATWARPAAAALAVAGLALLGVALVRRTRPGRRSWSRTGCWRWRCSRRWPWLRSWRPWACAPARRGGPGWRPRRRRRCCRRSW